LLSGVRAERDDLLIEIDGLTSANAELHDVRRVLDVVVQTREAELAQAQEDLARARSHIHELLNASGTKEVELRELQAELSRVTERCHTALTELNKLQHPHDIDADDIAMLKSREPDGSLVHPLCVFCGGWHIPLMAAAGCPRLKAGDLDKHQAVTHFEYHETWDTSRTVFPWQIADALTAAAESEPEAVTADA